MKETFREFITVIGSDKRVVLIMGDCGEGMCKDFALKYPDRFLNVGVCEQSMVGIAAGLALEGMIPYVITITPFLIERAFEQIKMDVDYMQANVKLIGYAHLRQAGLSHRVLEILIVFILKMQKKQLYISGYRMNQINLLISVYDRRSMDDFIHGDKFAELADVSRNWPEENKNLDDLGKRDQIVFCKIDFLGEVFEKLRQCDKKIVLITHNSDIHVDKDKYDSRPRCIKKWFAQNCKYKADDLIPIPIGLQRPKGGTLSGDYPAIQEQAAKIKVIRNMVYMNQVDRTNLKEREEVRVKWGPLKYVTMEHATPFKQFLESVHSHKFVLSPQGNNDSDAHRTWEAIYLGTIPIVKRSVYTETYSDLPILIVDNWDVIPEDELFMQYESIMKLKGDSLEKSTMTYWEKKIKETFKQVISI